VQLVHHTYKLKFRHPFGVSSNTRTETVSVFVRLTQDGLHGYGEACIPAYLGESVEETVSFFGQAAPLIHAANFNVPAEEVFHKIDALSPGHNAAKAALEIALNDLHCKAINKAFFETHHLQSPAKRLTSFTIGIADKEKVEEKISEALTFQILKIKAGTSDDRALIKLVRTYTNKPLYVDVNQGWTDKHFVLEMLQWLKDQNVVLVEQPMPVSMKEEMRWVTERSPIPTIADESVKRFKDLENLDGSFSGINIKLMKCAGLGEALKMIHYCKEQGIKIMLGCMAESSCGTSAMAQLMSLADYIDLDAPLLYVNDPFRGLLYENGRISVSRNPGTGAELARNVFV
jgi:L-alanine-DL-glutamate epimerase-like enolase superfamily enzyme